MKKTGKLFVFAAMTACLLGGGTSAGAANFADALLSSDGQIMTDVTTYSGSGDFGSYDGQRLESTFRNPDSLLPLGDGSLLVTDARNHMLRSIAGSGVKTYAGMLIGRDDKGLPMGVRLDGTALRSAFQQPAGLAADAAGNIYVADSGNNAIRKIDPAGSVTTLAGNGLTGDKDGKGTEATFNHPKDVAVAPDGTVYVADSLNHAIRRIAKDGQVTTLTADSKRPVEVTPGQVVWGGDYADGEIAKSKFNEPSGLAIDGKGNLYISDSGNQRIRYMDFSSGKVTTVAGGGTGSAATGGSLYGNTELYVPGDFADGDAQKAMFNYPAGLALTEEGGVLIADSMNHSIRYLHGGQVVTLAGDAGKPTGENDGIDRYARFYRPTDVAVTASGDIFIADSYNNKIRKLSLYQLPSDLPQDDGIKVVLGSRIIAFEAPPEIVNDRTMVPVRAITEALGYNVTYRDEDRSVQLSKDGTTVELYIGKTGMTTTEAGKPAAVHETDAAPYIEHDLTYVPVRFFAEEIGLDVQWDQATRTVIVRKKQSVQ
ncbi:stalk domain-containing protein [Paenibacillus doosanensis]|uniref:Serine/threonine-protein kinase PknD n=1 Tax=Paenibacillus konkukensis TaxID=2020716 RepID=A0ABY4RMB6_9BACL|nr:MULTISPECIES: stalk domain-containing protein [Paenibacillus]MCS7460131.1 stalk domain-containing protein [Paenibacillus doosanensis]UQZ82789.1 Serine/threonine-protein kinase PknD [Paenibacillus konkukensis]